MVPKWNGAEGCINQYGGVKLYCCPTLSRVTTKTLPSWFHPTSQRQEWCARSWMAGSGWHGFYCCIESCVHPGLRAKENNMPLRTGIEMELNHRALNSGMCCIIWFIVRGDKNILIRPWKQSICSKEWNLNLYIFATWQCICSQDKDISPRLSQPLLYPLI